MRIEIINIGTELMLGHLLNSHQQWLCRELSQRGFVVARQTAVDDHAAAVQVVVREAMERSDVIITTGGLGPTSDDRTRDCIAGLLNRQLREDERVLQKIEAFFGKRKRAMPASTRVQALVPEGAAVLENANGTAPGLVLHFNTPSNAAGPSTGGLLIMLPGPPRELRPMFTGQVLPILETHAGAREFACAVLKTTGIGESYLEERIAGPIQPLLDRGLEIGYCARVGEVDLRFIARGSGAAALVAEAEEVARRNLRGFIYAKEPELLDALIVRLLTENGQTLALAESCTGGFIANRITNIPGASAVFLAGLVTYSNEAKQKFLGVRPETLSEHGAVSEPVAREMADGIRARTGADFALSVTGIAGPSGGTLEKPVGTVFIGLSTARGTEVKRMLNEYDRETFKFLTSQQALDMLRRAIIHLADE